MKKLESNFTAIHFHDNVYVSKFHSISIDYDDEIDGAKEKAQNDLDKLKTDIINKSVIVFKSGNSSNMELFGGRIVINNRNGHDYYNNLIVDGIQIYILDGSLSASNDLSLDLLLNYLNAIAVYGIDEFLENYKKAIKAQIEELESFLNKNIENNQQLEENSTLRDNFKYAIRDMQNSLLKFFSLLFLLNFHFPLGIPNDKMNEVMGHIDKMFGYL